MKKVEKLARKIREAIKDPRNIIARNKDLVHISRLNEILDKICPIEKPFPKLMIHKTNEKYLVFIGKDKTACTVIDDGGIDDGEGWERTGERFDIAGGVYEYYKDCEIQIK